jgi:UDP-glucose 4-epimerase
MKTILVTGGAGFVGSHLCERLVALGHTVISLDNYFTGSRENHVKGVEYREGHTKDIETLVPESPHIVYHLGEYSRVEKSFEDIETVWDLNIAGTFAVLEFVRRRGSKIVYAGSSTKFADGGLGRDQSPYAFVKAGNTELVKNYGAWFSVPYAITYFYNVYGPRENSGAFGTVVEIFRQNYLAGHPLGVTLPGTQSRNFTHVDDIVEGLLLVGEKGEGDEFGLGDEKAYTIMEVATLFGGEVLMLPERAGNRQTSIVDTTRARALGWAPKKHLAEYIANATKNVSRKPAKERRVLVFSTTFYPHTGPAEEALLSLMEKMPELTFDVITAKFGNDGIGEAPVKNAVIHRVGVGTPFDKFLLPLLGARTARELAKKHEYLFLWSLFASYGTLAALFGRGRERLPLLVTLADQNITWYAKLFLRFVLKETDQIYASTTSQERAVAPLLGRMTPRKSLGKGDAFANQIRFAYSAILSKIVWQKR